MYWLLTAAFAFVSGSAFADAREEEETTPRRLLFAVSFAALVFAIFFGLIALGS